MLQIEKKVGKKNTPGCYFLLEEKVTKENFPESKPAVLDNSDQWFMRFQHSTKKQ